MPADPDDIITLGHGSGGLLTNRLLSQEVFSILSNDTLDERHDGAVLNLSGKLAFTTDSFVVSPIFFPGGDIGELAINGTVNDLAMCGAIPRYLSLSFIIEEGLAMTDFRRVLHSIKKAADAAQVQIVTGDTKVVERGKGDKLFINTSGIGVVGDQANIGIKRVKVGDKIIVSNSLANHGIAILSMREGLEFESTIESDTCPLYAIVSDVIERGGADIHLLRDATRGGVATVLTEIARDAEKGCRIYEKDIPVDAPVAGACELLGLDPLYVANEGVFVAIVEESRATDVIDVLKTFDAASNAAIIGEIVDDHAGQVVLTSRIGGKRVVNMLVGEQLPRIC